MERSNGGEIFNRDYYMDGKNAGLSNYENYSWMESETLALADHLKRHLGMKEGDECYDIGCARGYLVKALRMRGIRAWGYDISRWAIKNCDEAVKPYVSNSLVVNQGRYDWVFSKCTWEHIPVDELEAMIPKLANASKVGVFSIVPLSLVAGGRYARDADEADPSHVIKWTLEEWIVFLQRLVPSFTVSGSFHVDGLKPTSQSAPKSCGFLKMTRQ